MADYRRVGRDVRVLKSFWVRVAPCCVLQLDTIPLFFSLFFQRLFPCHHHFPPSTAIHWPVPELTIHPPGMTLSPAVYSEPPQAHSHDCHVPQVVDRLAGSRTSVV